MVQFLCLSDNTEEDTEEAEVEELFRAFDQGGHGSSDESSSNSSGSSSSEKKKKKKAARFFDFGK